MKFPHRRARAFAIAPLFAIAAALAQDHPVDRYAPVFFDAKSSAIVAYDYKIEMEDPGCSDTKEGPYIVSFADGRKDWLLGVRRGDCNSFTWQFNASNRSFALDSPILKAIRSLVSEIGSEPNQFQPEGIAIEAMKRLEKKAGVSRIPAGDCDPVIPDYKGVQDVAMMKEQMARDTTHPNREQFQTSKFYAREVGLQECYLAGSGDVAVIRTVSVPSGLGGSIDYPVLEWFSRDYLASRHENDRGFDSYKAGSFDRAIALFERAKALDPQYVNAILNLASVLARTGQREKALDNLSLANRLNPSLTRARISSDRDFSSVLTEPAVREILRTN